MTTGSRVVKYYDGSRRGSRRGLSASGRSAKKDPAGLRDSLLSEDDRSAAAAPPPPPVHPVRDQLSSQLVRPSGGLGAHRTMSVFGSGWRPCRTAASHVRGAR
uniref:UL101 n=1 Tax=Human cytomegalovirus TaxID=10359 RepID=Q6RXD6_HCMV|nr:UL101 [Human betaherpesvirus 5]